MMKAKRTMDSTRKLLVWLIVAGLLCSLASPYSPAGLAAVLTHFVLFGVILVTLSLRRNIESCGVPASAFVLPPASRAPPLG